MSNLLLLRRRGMTQVQQGGLPYDAKVEYLKNNGFAYVDIPITTYPTWVKEVLFSRNNSTSQQTSICGCFYPTTLNIWLNNSEIVFNYRGHENTFRFSLPINTQCVARANGNKLWLSYTGNTYTGTAGNNSNSTVLRLFGDRTDRNGVFSLYYYKIWDGNNTLVLDLIPVRVGTVGYMYDQISGQIFGKAGGTGNIVIGPDIV